MKERLRKNNVGKCLAIGIILLFIGTCIIPAIAQDTQKSTLPTSNDKTIYVDDDNIEGPWDGTSEHPYQFIIDGVNAAGIRDTVYVFKGLYQEGYIQIEKSIKLIGENRDQTIIDGTGHSWILIIKANNVIVRGFTFENCDTFDYPYDAALWIRTGNYNIISGNRFVNNDYASYVYTSFNVFCNNIIMDNQAGIWLNRGGFNIIYKNHFEGNNPQQWGDKHGLFLEGPLSFDNIVMKNNFIDNFPNAYFVSARFTRWINNYWADNIIGPKFIKGIIGSIIIGLGPDSKVIEIRGFQVDWHPAKTPYDIGV